MEMFFSFINLNGLSTQLTLKECKVHCSDGVKPECHLSAATVAKMTPFADLPKLSPHVQLPGFS